MGSTSRKKHSIVSLRTGKGVRGLIAGFNGVVSSAILMSVCDELALLFAVKVGSAISEVY